MNFNEPKLVNYFGSWVRVQVAFYDFIMKTALGKLDLTQEDILDFQNETNNYDRMIARCVDEFETPEIAWDLFIKAYKDV